jgi:hypothetical protein
MKESTEALAEIAHDDAETALARALAEFEQLDSRANELERNAEDKAKTFERAPTEAAFSAMKVADQLAKNARTAADVFNAQRVHPLREMAGAQIGARRYAELHQQVEVRTMIEPHADRISTMLFRFAEALSAEMMAFGKALSDRNQLVREANALAQRFGGQPDNFTYQHLTVAQALAEWVQPEIFKRLGALRNDSAYTRGCALKHVSPGLSTSSIELVLRLDATSLPFRAAN